MYFLENMVGRKIVMAVSGQMMVLFVIIHAVGNSTIYFGQLNSYAAHLHALPFLVWLFRLIMLTMLLLHVFYAIQLTLENRAAKPHSYAVKKSIATTFAGRTMIWSGIAIALFLVYHLLHFTVQVISPEISSALHMDLLGRPDVFGMVTRGLHNSYTSFFYILALTALYLHLTHGIQSFFQTLGLNNDRTMPVIVKAGAVVAVVLFSAYVLIPVVIMTGMLRV